MGTVATHAWGSHVRWEVGFSGGRGGCRVGAVQLSLIVDSRRNGGGPRSLTWSLHVLIIRGARPTCLNVRRGVLRFMARPHATSSFSFAKSLGKGLSPRA